MPCAILSSPADGATNVLVESTINWTPEPDVFGYSISLGTTPGGTDIANNVSVGVTPAFTPPLGLPESTTVFVTITVLIDQTTSVVCDSQSFTTINVTTPPGCTQVTSPANGAVDVAVDTFIQWSYAPRATGYLINLGTTPGGTDVLNGVDAGNSLSFNIPFDLDPNTIYYITIIPYNENGQTLGCTETTFTTEDIATEPPPCTTIINPEDGATEVALTPLVSWNAVSGATGYLITVGTSPGGTDVLDNADIGNTTSTLVLDFDEGTTYYIVISPYNDAGVAQGCNQTSFTTTLGCGPYEDVLTGEIIDLNPIINLEESYNICTNEPPLELFHIGGGDTFDWVQVNDGIETTISSNSSVSITEGGLYRLYVTEEVLIEAGFITCSAAAEFVVFQSEGPTIETVSFQNQGLGATVNVIVSGDGDYEYAIGNIAGPYQDSPTFTNVNFSNIEVFVRDRNGCGIASQRIDPDLGFPKYFTPNGDGINDFWQVRGVVVNGQRIARIEVFDRYGKRVADFSPFSRGWDGTFNGRRLLDTGFWYKATTDTNAVLIGHFALRRG
jgi:gliding motility-associated-like protein